MNVNKRFFYLFLVVAAVTMWLQPAFAKGYDSNYWSLEDKFFYKAFFITAHESQIGLSPQKVDVIKTLKYKVKKELISRDADLQLLALDIKEELHKRPIDVEKVNKLIDQKYDLKKNKDKFLVQAFADLKSTLSDEEWQNLKTFKESV